MYGPIPVETSLLEAALFLAKILAMLAGASLVVGIITLPLFYLLLLTINGWFWAADESKSRGDTAPATRSERRRAIISKALFAGLPIVSFAASFFLIAYFFIPQPGVSDPKAPTWGKDRFEAVTRSIAELSPWPKLKEKPPPAPPDANGGQVIEELVVDDGTNPEEERLKWPLRVVRITAMIGMLLIGPLPTLFIVLSFLIGRMGLVLIVRSLSRNLVRTSLTYLAIFVLVVVIIAIWSILTFMDNVMAEKETNLKAIITERNQIPSQMKPTHLNKLKELIAEMPEDLRPPGGDDDIMTWSFVGGSLDPKNRTAKNSLFFFCMEPRKVLTMLDGLEDLTGEQRKMLEKGVKLMEENPTYVVLGRERLNQIEKKVGDKVTLTSFNYTDLTFEVRIIGVLPEGTRYDQSAVMNKKYLERTLQAYRGTAGKEHPLADKSLNLIWVRLPNKKSFEDLAWRVNNSGKFDPPVKMETASSAISTFMDSLKDLLWALRYVLTPALLVAMTLVIANAISIGVRERRTEMAVLKVLGFRPWMVMALVLGEAVLIGAISGFMAVATAYALINGLGGIQFPIPFFPKFAILPAALWWGPLIGTITALLGSIVPAWSARSVKVSEVFAKVA